MKIPRHIAAGVVLAMTVLTLAVGGRAQDVPGWRLEGDVDPPTYAAISPARTTADVEELVLVCVEEASRPVLQLQIYSSDPSPLVAPDTPRTRLRVDPEVRLTIDGHRHPVELFFTDDYAVVADTIIAGVPALSRPLVDALQQGRTMVLQFKLFAKQAGEVPAFDGETMIDLQAGAGGGAIAALRRCVEGGGDRASLSGKDIPLAR